MSRLTDEEFLVIQEFIDRSRAELDRRGFTIEIDSDLSKWVRLMRRIPGDLDIASTHDPSRTFIHPANAFWVIIRERDQKLMARLMRRKPAIVACLCYRIVETDNIAEEIRTQRLFFDRKPILDFRPVELVEPDKLPVIGGKVGLAGGFWVHPKLRGSKLTNIVARVTRMLAVRHYGIDWHVSLVRDTPRRKAMIHNTYDISNSVSITRGFYPPYGRSYDMQMSYMHRDEMMRRIKQDNLEAAEEKALDAAEKQEALPAPDDQEAMPVPEEKRRLVN
jgi:hypothetical protein